MISKLEIKYYARLKQKKHRTKENLFIAEGKRLIEEGIKSKYTCEIIFVTNNFAKEQPKLLEKISKANIPLETLPEHSFKKLTSTQNPQGIVAVFRIPESKPALNNNKVIVALENISEPGNLGTILRICDWFGMENVFISNNSADIYNSKVLRASMGAIFHLNIFNNLNLVDKIKDLQSKNYNLFVADMKGTDYKEIKWQDKTVIAFCNEANGPSKELKNIADKSITIPKKGKVESLNVAAAAAIIISTVKLS